MSNNRGVIWQNKVFFILFFVGLAWLIYFFLSFPKQAWVGGLLYGWLFSEGLLIYKDFTSSYFPILYMSMYPFHSLFGFTQTPTILLAPFSSIFLFITLSIVSFKWLRNWLKVIPLTFFLLWDSILSENHFATTSYQNILSFFTFVLWWNWYRSPYKVNALLIGFFLGLNFMSSQIIVFFVAVIFISILFKCFLERRHWDSFFLFLVGFLISPSLIFFYLVKTSTLDDFYEQTITYYLSGSGYPYTMVRDIDNILMFFSVFSPLLIVGLLIYLLKDKRFKKITLYDYSFSQLVFWFLLLLSLPVPFWFAVFHPNRFLIGVGVFSLSLGLAIQMLQKNRKKMIIIGLSILLIAFLNIVSLVRVIIPKFVWGFSYPANHKILTKTYEDDPMFKVTKWISQETPKGARLFATTDSIIYIEADRLPINNNSTSNLPVTYGPFKQFGPKLQRNPPDYWVIDERQWQRFHDFGYDKVTILLQKILSCEPIVAKIEYVTVRKHLPGTKLCI